MACVSFNEKVRFLFQVRPELARKDLSILINVHLQKSEAQKADISVFFIEWCDSAFEHTDV